MNLHRIKAFQGVLLFKVVSTRFRDNLKALYTITAVFAFLAELAWGQSVSSNIGGLSATPTKLGPGSVFWNPATLGMLSGTQIETNLALAGGWMIYDRSGIDPNTQKPFDSADMSVFAPIPFISLSSDLGTSRLRLGMATYFPGGSMANFSPDGPQRFSLIEGYMVPWHNQITVAYKLSSDWTIALSGIYSVGFFKVNLAIDLEGLMASVLDSADFLREHPGLTARAEIPHSVSHSFGGALGIYYSPDYQVAMGFSIYSPIEYTFKNKVNLRMPSTVGTLGSSLRALGVEEQIESQVVAETHLPLIVQAGVSYQPYGYFTSELFGRYVFASMYKSTSTEIKKSPIAMMANYKRDGRDLRDTYTLGSVNSFSLWQNWTLGLSTIYSTNSVRDELLAISLADFDTLTVGPFVQWRFSKNLKLGAEYSHSFMFDRVAVGTEAADPSQSSQFRPVNSDGSYRAAADRFGIMVKYAF